jgi:hypothetical protein
MSHTVIPTPSLHRHGRRRRYALPVGVHRLAAAALAREVIVVGDSATTPGLIAWIESSRRVPSPPVSSPRLAALSGAGRAATAACWRPAPPDTYGMRRPGPVLAPTASPLRGSNMDRRVGGGSLRQQHLLGSG